MNGFKALVILLLILVSRTDCRAHPISVSDVYVECQQERLLVRIEVFTEDLYLFHNLPLGDDNALSVQTVQEGVKLHQTFLAERFLILNRNGDRLEPKFLRADTQDLPNEPIPFEQLMYFKVFYEFEFTFQDRPEYLTFLHRFTGEKVVLPAEVQVKVKPLQGRREQKILLPDQPWTIHLAAIEERGAADADMSPQEILEQRQTETLGIQSYGATYAFLYIEPNEIRLEALVPLATLLGSLDVELEPDGKLDLDDQTQLKSDVEAFFQKNVSLQFEGREQDLMTDRIEFFGVALRDFSQQREPEVVSIANARVGIILSAPVSESISSGQLTWDVFNEHLYEVNLAIVQGEETTADMIRPFDGQNVIAVNLSSESLAGRSSSTLEAENTELTERLDELRAESLQDLRWLWGGAGLSLVLLIVLLLIRRKLPVAAFTGLLVLIVAADIAIGVGLRQQMLEARREVADLTGDGPDVVADLLGQIYQAVNLRDEGAVFDQLSKVADEELLRELYLEIRESLTIESQGGSAGKAGRVDVGACELVDANVEDLDHLKFSYLCQWTVPGRLEHWGHIHERANSYTARIQLSPRREESDWKWEMTRIDLQNVDQSPVKTSVRRF
ncbi:hypothetical protein [Rubinisphaera margarita]|uniref:hypothetical protein n=1 Tax=Rubinisphaera margarita TaxID=2909586 RepID=UPI001EE7ECCA|nr:hypothetical protein [Rubinisphaera margarita]MCG6156214.1 hypothetical protein [Rubinisphaera margarita]